MDVIYKVFDCLGFPSVDRMVLSEAAIPLPTPTTSLVPVGQTEVLQVPSLDPTVWYCATFTVWVTPAILRDTKLIYKLCATFLSLLSWGLGII